ncbi:MAG TPA: hypothetical protein PLJ69_08575 [Methanothrix sp.]|nr:hypothetical protein [Methanothrix sp.]HPY73360.1 hypothetical protein [Methanothrix sp.]HQA62980.1 hypothetical protein [Methanothrix sp.]
MIDVRVEMKGKRIDTEISSMAVTAAAMVDGNSSARKKERIC